MVLPPDTSQYSRQKLNIYIIRQGGSAGVRDNGAQDNVPKATGFEALNGNTAWAMISRRGVVIAKGSLITIGREE